MPNARCISSLVAMSCLAGMAAADDILFLDFEDNNASGWTANGVPTLYEEGGNPGQYMGIPLADFQWISLSAREESSMVFGDLSRYDADIMISVDVRVDGLYNFDNQPMNPLWFPLVIQLWNYDIPADVPVSVYLISQTLPENFGEWKRIEFTIPNASATSLPPGWGGTGAEDPITYEPTLPGGVTYRDVLSNIGQVDISTSLPGHFYGPSFWQVSWDNLRIERVVSDTCPADFNGDGFIDGFDYDAFVACFEGDPCPPGRSPDMDSDGFVDGFDYDTFVTGFEEGCF